MLSDFHLTIGTLTLPPSATTNTFLQLLLHNFNVLLHFIAYIPDPTECV